MKANPTNGRAPAAATVEALGKSTDTATLFPAPASVKGRVLGALLRREELTHLDCWRRFGSSRLAHHVLVLRKAGWPVRMVESEVKTSDAGRQATIGRYSLPVDAIDGAGEPGTQYAAVTARIEAERRVA